MLLLSLVLTHCSPGCFNWWAGKPKLVRVSPACAEDVAAVLTGLGTAGHGRRVGPVCIRFYGYLVLTHRCLLQDADCLDRGGL